MSKYHNRKTIIDGVTFDSVAEARRFCELRLLAKMGEITGLKLQPEFTLVEGFMTPTGERIKPMRYKADFSYSRAGKSIVEDVKGVRTKEYLIKRKLLLDRFGIEVQEIEA